MHAFRAKLIVVAALGLAAVCDAATHVQPLPPSQICVNGRCTATAISTPPVATSGHQIKWNPGHYMAGDSVVYGGATIARVQKEMDDINNQDAIQGYRLYISWGALEPTQGNYDFSVVDAVLTRLKTAYNKPKRLVIYLWLYGQTKLGQNDGRVVPLYIQQSAAYGASPVSGLNGWWGLTAGNASSGMYAPAIYYAPVMDRLIALVQALGNRYDGDPNVEAIEFQEDATIAQSAYGGGNQDPHYSDAEFSAELKRLLTASTAAFPHTSVIMDNTWLDRPTFGVSLEQWMVANRIAPGTADVWGQTGIATYGTSHLSDGMQTLLGVSPNGGSVDLRPQARPMLSVEGTEIEGNYFQQYGGPWTPLDVVNALNQTYWASHAFWTHFFGNENFGVPIPAAAVWSNLVATVSANPLLHTDYPANYP